MGCAHGCHTPRECNATNAGWLRVRKVSRKYKVLVLPGTSEAGLEVMASLRFTREVDLWSGSVNPQFATELGYKNSVYVPSVYSDDFAQAVQTVCNRHGVDVVFPAHDEVAYALRGQPSIGGARVASHPERFLDTVRSKRRTYERVQAVIPTPRIYDSGEIAAGDFPVFAKPDEGQGSRGTFVIHNTEELNRVVNYIDLFSQNGLPGYVFSEYVTGKEVTVDCFSDANGRLLLARSRERGVVRSGISVHTFPFDDPEVLGLVHRLDDILRPVGAWFAQFKLGAKSPVLLEVGPRIAGSSGLWRLDGVNLSEMLLHQTLGRTVVAPSRSSCMSVNRRLSLEPCLKSVPSAVVLDFDDVIVVDQRINGHAVALAAVARALGIPTAVVSRHKGDLSAALARVRARDLFDWTVNIRDGATKAKHVPSGAWYFDDSFSERQSVSALVSNVLALDASSIPAMTAALCAFSLAVPDSNPA